MRGIWKDGFRKFSRDANVRFRGTDGRMPYKGFPLFDGWNPCGSGTRKYWGRAQHKNVRRAFKEELPGLLEDAHCEMEEWVFLICEEESFKDEEEDIEDYDDSHLDWQNFAYMNY